ncbi:MAG: hypothetical protein JWO49_3034 [Arthrobacter sp.]|nr:hypothetical protein [Arthrobacter sp.]
MASNHQIQDMNQVSERGFATMDVERQREIASQGDKAAYESGNAHEFTSGRKGGQKSGNAHEFISEKVLSRTKSLTI